MKLDKRAEEFIRETKKKLHRVDALRVEDDIIQIMGSSHRFPLTEIYHDFIYDRINGYVECISSTSYSKNLFRLMLDPMGVFKYSREKRETERVYRVKAIEINLKNIYHLCGKNETR